MPFQTELDALEVEMDDEKARQSFQGRMRWSSSCYCVDAMELADSLRRALRPRFL